METFMKKVIKMENGCWEWQGNLNKQGYGSFYFEKKSIGAHRASWLIFKGEIPEKLFVCHTCDNPKCVNPEHLFLGNAKMNSDDMRKKNRSFFQKLKEEAHRFATKRGCYKPHPLEVYFEENDIAISKAAKRMKISMSHLHRILRKTHYPSLKLAYKIERYTKGKVSLKEVIQPDEGVL